MAGDLPHTQGVFCSFFFFVVLNAADCAAWIPLALARSPSAAFCPLTKAGLARNPALFLLFPHQSCCSHAAGTHRGPHALSWAACDLESS